ncbi:MAG: hypothetical protein L3J93_01560 [Thermoplasmata archaeon]|nr:hypothetical protein [Thermoplasmata archaeon]
MTEDDPIASGSLPVAARSPAKCILFGEHAVVRGGPELVAAIDLHTQVGVARGPSTHLNGDPDASRTNAYLREALARHWEGGESLAIRSTSRIPKASGLGSSAAFTASLLAALGSARGGVGRADLAARAYQTERGAQGVGSPGDTSAVVAGGYISINAEGSEALWSVAGEDTAWTVRRVSDPGWIWVVAYSGIPRSTAEAVRAVGRRLAEPDGPKLLERFRQVALEGIGAVTREDRDRTGALLTENQALLREVGVSHPRLEALIDAAIPTSLGAKLTGAGAGGSIVALPRPGRELETARRIASAGGLPFVVRVEPRGVRIVESR